MQSHDVNINICTHKLFEGNIYPLFIVSGFWQYITYPYASLRFRTAIVIDIPAENYGNCNPTNWSRSSWEVYCTAYFSIYSLHYPENSTGMFIFFFFFNKMRHFLEGHVDNYCQDAKTACNYCKMPPAGKITSVQTFQVEIRSCNSHF